MNFNGFGCLYIIIFTTIYYLKLDIIKKLLSRTSVPTSIAADDSSRHPAVPQHPQDVHLHQVGHHLLDTLFSPLYTRTVVALALRTQLSPKRFWHNSDQQCSGSIVTKNPCTIVTTVVTLVTHILNVTYLCQ